jgi:hypothetical protein
LAAANALKELEAIRDNTAPYAQINRIDPLLSTVAVANDRIAGSEREAALLSIDEKLGDIEAALNQTQAEADLRNRALYPLQQLKITIAALNSIPRIRYLKEQAGSRLDEAMDLIASAQKPVGVKEPGCSGVPLSGAGSQPIAPAVKAVAVIRASECSLKTYLENESDIEAYLVKLREKLSATIREGKRVRIQ